MWQFQPLQFLEGVFKWALDWLFFHRKSALEDKFTISRNQLGLRGAVSPGSLRPQMSEQQNKKTCLLQGPMSLDSVRLLAFLCVWWSLTLKCVAKLGTLSLGDHLLLPWKQPRGLWELWPLWSPWRLIQNRSLWLSCCCVLLSKFNIPAACLLYYSGLMVTSCPAAYRPGQLWFSIPLTPCFSGPGSLPL